MQALSCHLRHGSDESWEFTCETLSRGFAKVLHFLRLLEGSCPLGYRGGVKFAPCIVVFYGCFFFGFFFLVFQLRKLMVVTYPRQETLQM